ncbi:MAG: uncharacterized protein JWM11_1734 [Planctomycetaceae bacterium]|nr:uncharacterized protein [Planctomycetaceae bacterium]
MSLVNSDTSIELHQVGIGDLRKRSGWILGLGVLLVVLGTLALATSIFWTLVTMIFIGWLMIFGGIMQTLHAFTFKAWAGFFLDLLMGIFYTIVGLMVVAHPGATALALTLMIAMLLIIGGIFRVAAAIAMRFPNTIWMLIHGAINVALGVIILPDWPVSGLWVIGTFIGIDMLFNGWSLIMLSLTLKNLPKSE